MGILSHPVASVREPMPGGLIQGSCEACGLDLSRSESGSLEGGGWAFMFRGSIPGSLLHAGHSA